MDYPHVNLDDYYELEEEEETNSHYEEPLNEIDNEEHSFVAIVNEVDDDASQRVEHVKQFHSNSESVHEGCEREPLEIHADGRKEAFEIHADDEGCENEAFEIRAVKLETDIDNYYELPDEEPSVPVKNELEDDLGVKIEADEERVVFVQEIENVTIPNNNNKFSIDSNEMNDFSSEDVNKLSEDVASDDEAKKALHSKTSAKLRKKCIAERQYPCDKCDYVGNVKQALNRHVETAHQGIRYKCSQCDFTTGYKYNLNSHMKAKHLLLKFSCDKCEYTSTERRLLNNHKNAVHDKDKVYACAQCDYTSGYKYNLNAHVKAKHQHVFFPCDLCDYTATCKRNLNSHVKTHHQGPRFPCPHCNADFGFKYNLNAHIKKKCPKRKKS